jgi:putative glutathione S-transferase
VLQAPPRSPVAAGLSRIDAVHPGHSKCNRWKLMENPVLWAYARDLCNSPGFGD